MKPRCHNTCKMWLGLAGKSRYVLEKKVVWIAAYLSPKPFSTGATMVTAQMCKLPMLWALRHTITDDGL